ncbi:MAG: hypothetical protein AABZ39_15105 [Spirochaetota bacterium]
MKNIFIAAGMVLAAYASNGEQRKYLYGACQMDITNAARTSAAGLSVAVINVGWNRGEPKRGEIDRAYLASVRAKIAAFRGQGIEPMLDLGFQYAPKWLETIPNARYVNQFGGPYVIWAFEPELFSGKYATLDEYAKLIEGYR